VVNELSNIPDLPHFEYLKKNVVYNYTDDGESSIEFNTFGLDAIPEKTIKLLQDRMLKYNALASTKLIVNQNQSNNFDNFRYMTELRTRDSMAILSQTQKITFLENKVRQLSKYEKNYIPLQELLEEIKINYESIEQFNYASMINSNFKKLDTLAVFSVKWVDSLANEKLKVKDKEKLEKWLKLKLNLDTLVVKRLN